MLDKQVVWVDDRRCLGCGKCVEACAVGAIAITNNMAYIDEATCTGCGSCVAACPEGAIQFVVEGEVVAVEERALPAVHQAGAVDEVLKPAVAVGTTAVLSQASRAVAQGAGRWLVRVAKQGVSSLGQAVQNYVSNSAWLSRGAGGGARHRERHRRGRG